MSFSGDSGDWWAQGDRSRRHLGRPDPSPELHRRRLGLSRSGDRGPRVALTEAAPEVDPQDWWGWGDGSRRHLARPDLRRGSPTALLDHSPAEAPASASSPASPSPAPAFALLPAVKEPIAPTRIRPPKRTRSPKPLAVLNRAGALKKPPATVLGTAPEPYPWDGDLPTWAVRATLAIALLVRVVDLNRFGFNGDEAVYSGQAASLAGNPLFVHQFPVFRAHPLLVPSLLSPLFGQGSPDVRGRAVMALFGSATVGACYLVARDLFGRRTGLVAAVILALMPYHIAISRQVLLDGPAVTFTVLSLWMLVRWVHSQRTIWLVASAGTLGLGVLSKETMVVMAGAMVAFILVSSRVNRPLRALAVALPVLVVVSLALPLALVLAHHGSTGQNYLAWQLVRSSNHAATFYFTTVAAGIGWGVIVAAGAALLLRGNRTWRELLLAIWVLVPYLFFEIYPLKGYPYVLPAAPAIAVLASRGLLSLRLPKSLPSRVPAVVYPAVAAALAASIGVGVWQTVFPSATQAGLAGQGGIPGGREAGKWVGSHLVPGNQLMTIGPSMANIIEYYSHFPAQGISVSTNPLHRNPAYVPIDNPDLAVRQGQFAFLVWDTYSADRSPSSAGRLATLLTRYHARPVHTEMAAGNPVIVIYQVHP